MGTREDLACFLYNLKSPFKEYASVLLLLSDGPASSPSSVHDEVYTRCMTLQNINCLQERPTFSIVIRRESLQSISFLIRVRND